MTHRPERAGMIRIIRVGICMLILISAFLPLFVLTARGTQFPEDGEYTIEITLSGGSGRAGIKSPAELTVKDRKALAHVEWSSPYYEYMLVDGDYYYPVSTTGNSVFEIPIRLDEDMAVSAQTIAMSVPHEIDYTLQFDSSTLKASSIDVVSAGKTIAIVAVLLAAAVLAVVPALSRRFRKRKRI